MCFLVCLRHASSVFCDARSAFIAADHVRPLPDCVLSAGDDPARCCRAAKHQRRLDAYASQAVAAADGKT